MDIGWIVAAILLVIGAYLFVRNRALSAENASQEKWIIQLREQTQDLSAQISASEQQHQTLTDAMIDPVLFVDRDRHITFCNPPTNRLAQDGCELGLSLIQVFRSYELDSIVEETLQNVHEFPREIVLNEHLFRVRTSLLLADGKIRGAVVILRDISELQRLGRARRDFVANISHELRTPLTAIRLLVDTLRRSGNEDSIQRTHYLDQIGTQVDALTQLAQEMYDLSLIESGQVPMRMVRASLNEMVDRAMQRLLPQAERAGTTLVNAVPKDTYALVDPDQINRVLSNLIHNAIKFTSQGKVTVEIAQTPPPPALNNDGIALQAPSSDDFVAIAVRDTGVGIAKTDQPRIFERFYKVNRARGKGGTGLGLAIAKHIVEAHGGRIWVDSVEGHGATFYFTMPKEG